MLSHGIQQVTNLCTIQMLRPHLLAVLAPRWCVHVTFLLFVTLSITYTNGLQSFLQSQSHVIPGGQDFHIPINFTLQILIANIEIQKARFSKSTHLIYLELMCSLHCWIPVHLPCHLLLWYNFIIRPLLLVLFLGRQMQMPIFYFGII